MRKALSFLLVIVSLNAANADEWQHRTSLNTIKGLYEYQSKLFVGRVNGITVYDLETEKKTHYTELNSELPGNQVNAFLKLTPERVLVSTDKGLAMLLDGEIVRADDICLNYPDSDSRNLYQSADGAIWTFSSHKIYRYKDGAWKSFNLEDSVAYHFDIYELFIQGNRVWAMFNDNTLTDTKYYGSDVIDLRIKMALLDESGIIRMFESKMDFPYRQGGYILLNNNENILIVNYDGVYSYDGTDWSATVLLNAGEDLKPSIYSSYIYDDNGNIWYYVTDNKNIALPASFNIAVQTAKLHLENEQTTWITSVGILEDGTITAHSSRGMMYFFKDGEWTSVPFEDIGLKLGTGFSPPYLINRERHVTIQYGSDIMPYGTMYNIDRKRVFSDTDDKFPYNSITFVAVNQYGQGLYKGRNSYLEPLMFETNAGFVKPNLISNVCQALPNRDGLVYFNRGRVDNTLLSPYLTTWRNNDTMRIDMGFSSMPTSKVDFFDSYDNWLIALGEYNYHKDSLNVTLSLYNTTSKELYKYDKSNSCMPDYYLLRDGYFVQAMDTVAYSVAMDKDMNVWIETSASLIMFAPSGCQYFDKLKDTANNPMSVGKLYYDIASHELIGMNYRNNIFSYKIQNNEWKMNDFAQAGLNGNSIVLKKLLDNRVWVADNLGYLYYYSGDGKFKEYDLKINGKSSFGFAINDFSLDANGFIHIGTDIGLFSNVLSISGVVRDWLEPDAPFIFPNPATDIVYVEIENSQSETVLLNSLGIPIESKPLHTIGRLAFDISDLPQGVYFVKSNGKVGKFIKIGK